MKTVDQLLAWEIPHPFTKGQKKNLGNCTVEEIKESAKWLEATDGPKRDIIFLRHLAHGFRAMGSVATLYEARYNELAAALDWRKTQTRESRKGKSK